MPEGQYYEGAERVLPHNERIEQMVLGALMVSGPALDAVQDFLKPFHFGLELHISIMETIQALHSKGKSTHPMNVGDLLLTTPGYASVGGFIYLQRLTEISAISFGKKYLVEQAHYLVELYHRRALIQAAGDLIDSAFDVDVDVTALSLQEKHEAALLRLATDVSDQASESMVHISVAVDKALHVMETALQRDGQLVGITTGLTELDQKMGGFHDMDLIILGGRPGAGKTSLMLGCAFAAAKTGKKVGIFSLEQPDNQLAGKGLSSEAKVNGHRVREGRISQAEALRMVSAAQTVKSLPIYIYDRAGISISHLRSVARRQKRASGLDFLMIDYLQLLRGELSKRNQSRAEEVTEITVGLKSLAKELNIPILALSQLSREVEKREDKRPQLADLRESGSVEQDADIVMFVFREEYYLERSEPPSHNEKLWASWKEDMLRAQGKGEIILAKQRHGPLGTCVVAFDGSTTTFRDLHAVNEDDL